MTSSLPFSFGRARAAIVIVLGVLACSACTAGESVRIAAAANLVYVLDALNAEFERVVPAVKVRTSSGASGSLFAQIRHGAPFDVFLSADTEYPRQMIAAGLADANSLRPFATGRLVFWTVSPTLEIDDIAAVVRSPEVRRLAIAQPATAPYGRAALATLEHLGVDAEARRKLVLGESISQTAQFVETGNAEAGFVAMSLVVSPRLARRGRWVEVPATAYAGVSLAHAAVITRRGMANPAAKRYLDFLSSEPAQAIFRRFGYGVP